MAEQQTAENEVLYEVVANMNRFMENQTRIVNDLVSQIAELKARMVSCEKSQEDHFRTRLDDLANEDTPPELPQAATSRNPFMEGQESLLHFDDSCGPTTSGGAPPKAPRCQQPLASQRREEFSRVMPPQSEGCEDRRAPLGTSRPVPLPQITSSPRQTATHSTPRPPPSVRFCDTFAIEEPCQRPTFAAPPVAAARVKVSPQEFSGKQAWVQYRKHYETVAKISGWDDEMKALYLGPFLRGTALAFYDTLSEGVKEDFARLDAAFAARFSNRYEKTVAHIKLRGCVQTTRESLVEFATRVQEYAALAFESDAASTREAVGMAQFIDGVADLEIQQRVRDAWPKSIEEALALAERIEASREATRICRRQVRVAVAEMHRSSSPRSPPPTRTQLSPRQPSSPRSPRSPRRHRGRISPRRERPGDSQRQRVTERGVRGRIRLFIAGRNFGFATRSDNGENVFIHRNELINVPRDSAVSLEEGDEVLFDVVWTNRTPAARNVTLVSASSSATQNLNRPGRTRSPANDRAIASTSRGDLNSHPLPFRG